MQVVARSGESIDMEACFSQLTLDVIGKAVFNYDFNALTTSSPLIQVGQCPASTTLQCDLTKALSTPRTRCHVVIRTEMHSVLPRKEVSRCEWKSPEISVLY